jgi:hypothetical protein
MSSRFFRLPAELRNMVYKELHITAHHQEHPWVYGAPTASVQPTTFATVRFTLPLQVLRTCKQIEAEASPVLIPKRETIRKLVPKMIASLQEVHDNSQRDEIYVYLEKVRLWLDQLLSDPFASFDDFWKKMGNNTMNNNIELWNDRLREEPDDFDGFSEQNNNIGANTKREAHQAGIQLLSRYPGVLQPTAEPVAYLQVQCRVLDGRTVICRCRELTDDDDADEDNNMDLDMTQRLRSSITGVMEAGWNLLPSSASNNRRVNIGMTDVCGCAGDVYTTYEHKWLPSHLPLPHYGSHFDADLSDEVKAWKAWEKSVGWVHGEVVELPKHLL